MTCKNKIRWEYLPVVLYQQQYKWKAKVLKKTPQHVHYLFYYKEKKKI